MARSAPTALLPFAAASVGALLGVFAGVMLSGGRTIAPPTQGTTDLAPLLDELRLLRRELGGRAAIGTSPTVPTAPPVERQEAVPATLDADTARLAATVADLVQAVEALTVRADVLGAQRAVGRGVLAQTASGSSRDVPALLALAKELAADHGATQVAWMFTPATEVLRRFGRPSSIGSGEGGQQWQYEFHAEDQGWWLGITIADGVVVRID